MFHIHAHPAPVFENPPFDAFPRGAEDHLQPALLSRPPDVGGFTAQGGFIKVSPVHAGNYILHLFIAHAKIGA
jgi:hypothetical protein